MTTKEQERKALAQIKKIVDSLGECSYVGTALDGALSLAEQNIEFDAAFSARYYQDELIKVENNLKIAEATVAKMKTELAAQKESYEQAYELLSRRVLNHDDIEALKNIVAENASELQAEVNNAAARIVEAADDATSAAFNIAVADHRAAKHRLARYDKLIRRLCKIVDETNAAD